MLFNLNLLFNTGVAVTDHSDIPDGFKATELGVLPVEWNIGKLNQVGGLVRGVSYKETDLSEEYQSDFLPVLRAMNIQAGWLDLLNDLVFVRTEKISEKQMLKSGDIVIAMSSGSKSIVGKAAQLHDDWEGSFGAFCACFRPRSDVIDNEFIGFLYQTNTYREYIEKSACGTNIKNLTIPHILNYPIPLPPLPEQHAIAATLRTVQEAKEKTDAVIAATKVLKAAMMKHLFTYGPVPPAEAEKVALKETEIGQVPKIWEIKPVDELFDSKLGKMLSPASKTGKFSKPYLRNANVQWGRVDISDLYEMDFSENNYDRYGLVPGDVLICEGGEIGRTAIWRGELKECYYQKAIHRLRPRNTKISPEFFSYHMMYAFLIGKTYPESGTTTTIAHLPGMKLKSLLIPVPSRKDQYLIVSILSSIDQKLAAEQSRKEALDTLFTSLLHDLMTAKIRVSTA
jgi:type I restriction enzyme, S subunit